MTRTKIRQEIQISNSEVYNDAYAAAHTAGGAEPAFNEANIEHDLNVLRTNMRDLKGTADWFGSTTHSIQNIDGYVTALETFVGSTYGDTNPSYSSTLVVTPGVSLETAIGQIDAYIGVLDPIVTLQDTFNNSQSQGQTSPEINLGASVNLNIGGTGTSKLHVEAAGGLEVDGPTKLDGALQYTVAPTAGHFLKTDASGNAAWTQILGSDVDVTAGTSIGLGATTAQQYLDQLEDGYDYHEVEINDLESATGTTGGAATNNYSSNDLIVDGTSLLVAIGALDDGYGSLQSSLATLDITAGAGMTETGSLQAGTLVFDVVGTAGQITANANDIQIANAFNKTNFTSFQATSSGGINLDATTSAVSIDAGATSNLTVTGGGDLDLRSVTGQLDLDGSTVVMDSVTTTTLTSGSTFNVNATGNMTLDSVAASVVSGASVELASDGGDVILDASGDIVLEDGDGTYANTVADAYVWVTKTSGTGEGKWSKLDNLVSGLVTLQEAFDASHTAGDNPDISVDAGEDLDIFLTDVTSRFVVKDGSDSSPSLEMTSEYFKVYGTHSDSPTFMVNTVNGDGYVLIDGYLAITGNAIQVETLVTDADHMLLSPGLGSTAPALEIAPDSGNSQHIIDVHAVGDGYTGNNIVFRIENDGDAYFSRNVLVQPGAGQYFQYDHSTAVAGYYLKSIDASGNSVWSDFSALAGSGLSFAGGDFDVNIVAGETIIDGDAVGIDEAFNKTNFTTFVATSSGGMSLTATASAMSLTAGSTLNATVTGAMTLDSAAAAVLSGATVELDSDGGAILLDASTNITLEDGDGTYANTVADAYVWTAKTSATGQGKWNKLTAANIAVTDTFDVTNATNLQTILDDFDAYMVDSRMQIDTTQGSIGYAINGTGAWVGFSGTNLLNSSATISDALDLLDDGYGSLQSSLATLDITAGAGMTETGSLQAGTLVFDVVGTAGQITANANDIQIANAFNKTNFTSFQATSSGAINFDTSAAFSIDAAGDSNFTVTGVGNDLSLGSVDGYLYFEDKHLNADGYTSGVALSTNLLMPASGWSTSIIAAAGGTSIADIGIIDAINAAASLGGGKVEKAVYVIGASDTRLFATGALSSNGLDLDAGSGANRGSVDLNSVGLNHKMERDVEVFVNGVLQLSDATQGTATGSASDDYYVASNDLTKIVFSFNLVQGDVVTVVNRKADSSEDVDTGWTY